MSTYAAAYSASTDDIDGPSVDLVHQDIDGDEAGWDNLPGAADWGTDAADDRLAAAGWRRTEPWKYVSDLAGVPGWTASVKRA